MTAVRNPPCYGHGTQGVYLKIYGSRKEGDSPLWAFVLNSVLLVFTGPFKKRKSQ